VRYRLADHGALGLRGGVTGSWTAGLASRIGASVSGLAAAPAFAMVITATEAPLRLDTDGRAADPRQPPLAEGTPARRASTAGPWGKWER